MIAPIQPDDDYQPPVAPPPAEPLPELPVPDLDALRAAASLRVDDDASQFRGWAT